MDDNSVVIHRSNSILVRAVSMGIRRLGFMEDIHSPENAERFDNLA